jgi:hypothetical protein
MGVHQAKDSWPDTTCSVPYKTCKISILALNFKYERLTRSSTERFRTIVCRPDGLCVKEIVPHGNFGSQSQKNFRERGPEEVKFNIQNPLPSSSSGTLTKKDGGLEKKSFAISSTVLAVEGRARKDRRRSGLLEKLACWRWGLRSCSGIIGVGGPASRSSMWRLRHRGTATYDVTICITI